MSLFILGDREQRDDGTYVRQDAAFRDWPEDIVGGRYHLYVSWACPWAHRTIIARRLMGLEGAITMSAVDPIRDREGWEFTGGEYGDPVNGFAFLSNAYEATEPDFEGSFNVPVLWDTQEHRIVNNESADIMRMMSTRFAPLAAHPVELVPEHLRDEIDALNAWLYDDLNNAVYKAGFTTRQDVYESEVRGIFATLDALDERLASSPFLFGSSPLETDWRLFTTLIRFDAVYAVHFKCSLKRIVDYPHLWPYLRRLYQWPGIRETVRFDEIRRHYYRTHPSINPTGLVAVMPAPAFEELPESNREDRIDLQMYRFVRYGVGPHDEEGDGCPRNLVEHLCPLCARS